MIFILCTHLHVVYFKEIYGNYISLSGHYLRDIRVDVNIKNHL